MDEILTEAALEQLYANGTLIDLADGDPSIVPVPAVVRACPQLGALIDAATQQENQLPEWLANSMSDTIREMAHAAVGNLHDDDRAEAVAAIAEHLQQTASTPRSYAPAAPNRLENSD